MDENPRTTGMVIQHFVRGLGIGGLSIIVFLGLADRVNATYFHSDSARVRAPARDYIDREWYCLLDDGQYYYLDKGQYNVIGELGYLLGHPCYPKLFEKDLDQAVGFTNRVNTGWFSSCGYTGQVPISNYVVLSRYFKAGDYLDRGQYYYLDKGRYYYLDRGQYNWLGGLGYMFERPSYQRQYHWDFYQWRGDLGVCHIPEPSTITFLGLGALVVLGFKKYRKVKKKS